MWRVNNFCYTGLYMKRWEVLLLFFSSLEILFQPILFGQVVRLSDCFILAENL